MRIRFCSPLAVVLGGLLLSASAQEPAQRLVTKTYAVADLIVPMADVTCAMPACADKPCSSVPVTAVKKAEPLPCPAGVCCATGKLEAVKGTTEKHLMDLITRTIKPHTWSCQGGPAMMDYYPLGMALIITADPAMHEQIQELLQSLRRLQDVSVAMEVRVISLADGFAERIGLDCNLNGLGNPCERLGVDFNACAPGQCPGVAGPGGPAVVFWNDKQVMKFMEVIQGDQRTNVLSTPKITVLNGQSGTVQVGEQHSFVTGVNAVHCGDQVIHCPRTELVNTGFEFKVQPAVSADGKFVQMKLGAEFRSLASAKVPLFPITTMITPVFEGGAQGKPVPFTQYIQQPATTTQRMEKVVCVPDGGTVVIGGLKRTREVERECAHPVLSKVPYVNRMFRAVKCDQETETVIMLVTPRIVVNKEETQTVFADKMMRPTPTPTPMHAPMVAPPMTAPQMAMPMPPATPIHQATYVLRAAGPVERAGVSFRAKQVAKLMEMYHEACAAGHTAEAKQIAGFALEMDAACFSRARPMPTPARVMVPPPMSAPVAVPPPAPRAK